MSTKNGTRRTAAAVLLLGLGLGTWVALAPAATTIRVTQPDGDVRRVDIANIPPDVGPNQEYVVDGESLDVTGVSLARLLSRAGVPPRAWSSVQVGSVFLTDDQYQAFPDDTPPAFFDDQGDATFIVPDRGDRTGVIVPGAPGVAASRYSVSITPEARRSTRAIRSTSRRRSAAVRAMGSTSDGAATASTRSAGGRSPTASRTRAERPCRSRSRRGGATLASDATTVFVGRKPDDDDGTGGSSTGTGGAGYSDSSTSSDSTGTTPSYPSPTYDSPSATPSTPSTSPEATPGEPDPAPPADQASEVAGDLLADTTPIPPAGSTGADAGLPDTPEESADDQELAISGAAVAAGRGGDPPRWLGAGWEFERIRPRRWLSRPDLSRLRRLLPR